MRKAGRQRSGVWVNFRSQFIELLARHSQSQSRSRPSFAFSVVPISFLQMEFGRFGGFSHFPFCSFSVVQLRLLLLLCGVCHYYWYCQQQQKYRRFPSLQLFGMHAWRRYSFSLSSFGGEWRSTEPNEVKRSCWWCSCCFHREWSPFTIRYCICTVLGVARRMVAVTEPNIRRAV